MKKTLSVLLSSCVLGLLFSCASKGHFLSDTDPAYKALENEQRQSTNQLALLRRQSVGSDYYKQQMLRKYAEQSPTSPFDVSFANARLPKSGIKLPTRFEDPLEYSALLQAYTRVTNSAVFIGKELPELRFGTLPTLTLNAETVQFDGVSNKVVVLNHKLFSAMQSLLSCALNTVELHEERNPTRIKITSNIGTNAVAQFQKTLLFLLDVDPLREPQYTRHVRLYGPMFLGMYCFVVAHEYAHVVNKDVPFEFLPLRLSQGAGTSAAMNASKFVHSWQQEIKADQFATLLQTGDAARSITLSFSNMVRRLEAGQYGNEHWEMLASVSSSTSPLLVFRCNQIMEEALNLNERRSSPLLDDKSLAERFYSALDKETDEEAYSALEAALAELRDQLPSSLLQDSHPPSAVRHALEVIRLQKIMTNPKVQKMSPTVKQALELGFVLDSNLRELWNQTKPILPELLQRARERNAKDHKL